MNNQTVILGFADVSSHLVKEQNNLERVRQKKRPKIRKNNSTNSSHVKEKKCFFFDCEMMFENRKTMLAHVSEFHHNKCGVCGVKAKQASGLCQHMKFLHSN